MFGPVLFQITMMEFLLDLGKDVMLVLLGKNLLVSDWLHGSPLIVSVWFT